MPGSIAETLYGRRGGGWLPPSSSSSSSSSAPPAITDTAEVEAKPCGACARAGHDLLRTDEHTPCAPCNGFVEHHRDDELELCWTGRARMAAATRDAGGQLTDVDLQALARHPQPTFLTPIGYR